MSEAEVSFILVGSIVCTSSCETVPAPSTGIDAVSVTWDPGLTDAAEELTVTALEEAAAGSPIAIEEMRIVARKKT